MSESLVLVTTDGPIGTLCINNPNKKNAVSNDMLKVMDEGLQRMEAEGIRAVIIKGFGNRIFCSGYDVTTFSHALTELEEKRESGETRDYLRLALRRIENVGMPVISMINGHCIGAGVDISLACDLRYAAAGVKLQVPPAKLGIVYNPDGIARAVRVLGTARAKELFFLGESVMSEEAYEMGLVNKVLPADELEEFTAGIAATLAENAPLSLKGMKAIFRFSMENRRLTEEQEREAERLIIEAMKSRDAAEAVQAFLERRKPLFAGK